MPSCLKCGTALAVNEEGVAPVLCDRCAGVATGRARRSMALSGMGHFPVTTLLLAINILAYLVDMVPGINLREWGVNYGPLTLSGQYWRLFTAGFLHGGIFHIAFNMWCLWSLGRLSERLFGRWQTFAIYMVTGVGGALLSIAYNPQRAELGASGAIFGLVGAVMAGVKFGDLNISAGEKRSIFSSVVILCCAQLYPGHVRRRRQYMPPWWVCYRTANRLTHGSIRPHEQDAATWNFGDHIHCNCRRRVASLCKRTEQLLRKLRQLTGSGDRRLRSSARLLRK